MSDEEPLSLRERRRRETELAIRDAALELFTELGTQMTTVDQIAELAGVSTRTFFRYFETKEAAVLPSLCTAQTYFDEIAASISTLDDFGRALNGTFREISGLNDSETDRSRAFFRLLATDPTIREATGAREAQFEQWLVRRIAELLPDENVLELRLLIATSIAQSRTVWAHWHELDQDPNAHTPSIEELTAQARDILARRFK